MRYLFLLLLSFLTILLVWINVQLYSENYTPQEKKADIILQLNFLEKELKEENLGLRMQQIFPEGFVFVNAIYGLAWCELASHFQNDSSLQSRAIAESLFAFDEINSENGKRNFEMHLSPQYGIFYSGWKNYLLSKILMVDTSFHRSQLYMETFNSDCDSILRALIMNPSPYLESYSSQSWPADIFPAMASLSNHDKIFYPEYTHQISIWIQQLKSHLDPATGLIPHEADFKTGQPRDGARGSSISLMIRLLYEINPSMANEQFERFKKIFVTSTLGLPSVREYPKGITNSGDIDSGPVIFGTGFSATISAIGTFAVLHDFAASDNQYKTVHAFGFSIKTSNYKKYLFGKLPMADAFIAWGRASGLKGDTENSAGEWRILFNIISLLTLALLWLLYFRKLR